jgi:hypothetical protein
MRGIQIALMMLNICIILQVLLLHSYYSLNLAAIDIIVLAYSSILWLYLSYFFLKWYIETPNFTILIFFLAFLVSGITYTIILLADAGDFSIKSSLISISNGQNFAEENISSLQESVLTWTDNIDIIRFTLLWLGITLLINFRLEKMGKVKSILFMSIPFILYISFFQMINVIEQSEFYLFFNLIYLYISIIVPNIISIVLYIISKPFFDNRVLKEFVIITIVGFTLHSITGFGALYHTMFPPFGMLCFSLFALSNFLILIGLYTTTTIFASNRNLQEKLRNYSKEMRFFLDSSTALKNGNILKNVISIINTNRQEMKEQTEIELAPSSEEINKYVDEVIHIINQSKRDSDLKGNM